MNPTEALVAAVFAAMLVAIAGRLSRVHDSDVDRWAEAFGVELTGASRPVVHRYLRWSRRFRTMGGIAGLVAPSLVSRAILQRPLEGSYELTLAFAGYLLGALVAEVLLNRNKRSGGAALLVPRRLGDYLPAYVPLLQRGLGALCLLLLLLYLIWPSKPADFSPSPTEVVIFGVAGLLLAVVVEVLQRAIVARRQPIFDGGDAAVDDAMRSSSLHVLAAGGIALMLHIAGGEVMVVSFLTGRDGPGGALGWALLSCGVLLLLASIASWIAFSRPHRFRVWRGGESVST